MLAKSIAMTYKFMPELPEVETTKNGIYPHLMGQTIIGIIIRNPNLRWPVAKDLPEILQQRKVINIFRRAKYIIIKFEHGHLLIHLGMTGILKIIEDNNAPIDKHAHVDFLLANKTCLRYQDPRRFGSIVWTTDELQNVKALKHLGPEPLSPQFNATYLLSKTQNRQVAIKSLIMNQEIVVGVGNIYANEALFISKIHPLLPAKQLTLTQGKKLIDAIKLILEKAIRQGGTTLNDYRNIDGKPGYFQQQLLVYGRNKAPCPICQTPISMCRVGQRSTFFCQKCQSI